MDAETIVARGDDAGCSRVMIIRCPIESSRRPVEFVSVIISIIVHEQHHETVGHRQRVANVRLTRLSRASFKPP